uniref:ORF59 n=1 Tax=Oryza sativa TaxID=4530 RepID=Q35296_ORYSA|nr:ORF59 [Oryza sativa Indica Group]
MPLLVRSIFTDTRSLYMSFWKWLSHKQRRNSNSTPQKNLQAVQPTDDEVNRTSFLIFAC